MRKRLLGLLALVAVIVALLPLGAGAKGKAPLVSSLTAEASCGEVTVTSVNHSGLLVVVDFGYGEATRDGTAFGAPPDLIIAEGPRAGQPFGLFYESPNGMLFAVANGATESRTLEIPEDEGGGEVVVTYRIKAGPEQLNHTIDSTIPVTTDCLDEVTAVPPTVIEGEACGVNDSFTIPDTEGVTYFVNGEEAEAGTVFNTPGDYTVTAEAEDGYELTDPEWSMGITLEAGEPCTTTSTTTPTTTPTTEESTTLPPVTTTPPTTEETLPFTGIGDFYLPTAIALVAAGGLLLALSRRPEEDVA